MSKKTVSYQNIKTFSLAVWTRRVFENGKTIAHFIPKEDFLPA